jgi:hypothetical protein
MIQIMFASHDDAMEFQKGSEAERNLLDMENEFPRAKSGEQYFIGTVSNSETTSLIIEEQVLKDPSKKLVSDISNKIITFEKVGTIYEPSTICTTPDGSGSIDSWSDEKITYLVKLDDKVEPVEYPPQQVTFKRHLDAK